MAFATILNGFLMWAAVCQNLYMGFFSYVCIKYLRYVTGIGGAFLVKGEHWRLLRGYSPCVEMIVEIAERH